jgi:hypothetical protein
VVEIKSLEGIENKANIKLLRRTLDLGTSIPLPEQSIDMLNDIIIVDSGAGIDYSINTQLLSLEITPKPKPK